MREFIGRKDSTAEWEENAEKSNVILERDQSTAFGTHETWTLSRNAFRTADRTGKKPRACLRALRGKLLLDMAIQNRFMIRALELARTAALQGETPVGAVIVLNDQIIGSGYNLVETHKDPTAHAEVVALREATRHTGDWRLPEATLYVTLEPCIMCAAALIHARVKRVVFGAWDDRWGGLGTLFDFAHDPRINHEIEVVSGIMAEESASLLRDFYQKLREEDADQNR